MGRQRKPSRLSVGRPPTITEHSTKWSARTTRRIIRTHHELNRARSQAEKNGDESTKRLLDQQLAEQGGLDSYQKASILGQSTVRGGDSSKVLMEWLKPKSPSVQHTAKYRMLEVGALSTRNACSLSGKFTITCIDLNSQHSGILQQDFMARPLPETDEDKFDIISLSLVLNYVPTAEGRGQMLRRVAMFLNRKHLTTQDSILPALFLVLPAPCVLNSRYFSERQLAEMMQSMNYVLRERKCAKKLIYWLWYYDSSLEDTRSAFPKTLVNEGKKRNNFHVVLT